ncbi:DNA-3-methyladenine glycosylase I [Corynebacterium epidermidicanis]|uniref:DNA-3-methyladenine glycosylase I n=1 Tax=Corynebacterium epidermidicanis TaxID=1050174 RepID=A0A0G3GR72_9CORY|nr:DNA-3-methyladenine glycosylase I [Corynebacterium epidermidicanis]AKK02073.1 DNA-3-methyladenine glycosylase I [Corynebacterium epidermidicanis]
MTTFELTPAGLVLGVDNRLRPQWATTSQLLQDYYDYEWGRPPKTESEMFERIVLEGFQAGLSWEIVLKKRPAFREAFCDFEVDRIASFGEADVAKLLANPDIIRNQNKIRAAINNAQRVQQLRAETDLITFLQNFAPVAWERPTSLEQAKTKSAESAAMARELRRRGFKFVGETTCFALMEATGMIDNRIVGAAALLDVPDSNGLLQTS